MGEADRDPGGGWADEVLHAVGTPAELRALLAVPGVDDAVIGDFARSAGIDGILDRLFTVMASRFLPEKAGRARGAVRWDVQGPDGVAVYTVQIGQGRAEVVRGAPDGRPKVALALSLADLLRLSAGTLNGVKGLMTGRIHVSGDLLFAARLQGWFDQG
jgi:hypothetical protein